MRKLTSGVGAGGLFGAFGLFFLAAPSAIIFMATQGFGSIHAIHWLLGYWNIILGLFLWVWGSVSLPSSYYFFLLRNNPSRFPDRGSKIYCFGTLYDPAPKPTKN